MAVTPTIPQLPNAKVPMLNQDGTVTLPWRLFFQSLARAMDGSSGEIATLQAEITNITDTYLRTGPI